MGYKTYLLLCNEAMGYLPHWEAVKHPVYSRFGRYCTVVKLLNFAFIVGIGI